MPSQKNSNTEKKGLSLYGFILINNFLTYAGTYTGPGRAQKQPSVNISSHYHAFTNKD